MLDQKGAGCTSNVINAIQWAIANRATYGIDVINLSLSYPIFEPAATDPLVQAVEAAVRCRHHRGRVGGQHRREPVDQSGRLRRHHVAGNAPSAITVGSEKTFDTTMRADDVIADYSSRGPSCMTPSAKPDIVAPGHRLLGPTRAARAISTRTIPPCADWSSATASP